MFKLEESGLAAELAFSQLYLSAVKKIQLDHAVTATRRPVTTPPSRVAMPTKPSLGAIADVAAAAVASIGIMATVDQVLIIIGFELELGQ